jgi:hypothetical protein
MLRFQDFSAEDEELKSLAALSKRPNSVVSWVYVVERLTKEVQVGTSGGLCGTPVHPPAFTQKFIEHCTHQGEPRTLVLVRNRSVVSDSLVGLNGEMGDKLIHPMHAG